MKPSIVWFRQDLRLDDNPALRAACKRGGPILPVYIWSPEEDGAWAPGGASRWWLHHALEDLAAQLSRKAAPLQIHRGPSLDVLRRLITEHGAEAVFWNRRYEPEITERDAGIKEALQADGIEVRSFNGSLLFEPGTVKTKTGNPFQVFTPFYRACMAREEPPEPLSAPRNIPGLGEGGEDLAALGLLPDIPWDAGIEAAWQPDRKGAFAELERFLPRAFAYPEARDNPSTTGTSRLSPYLHFGQLSPRTVWHAVHDYAEAEDAAGTSEYLRQLVWRDFAFQLLFHFPHTDRRPLREPFAGFPWKKDARGLKAWQQGHTGYPLVDAGMRELWQTGWMHNRVRMITGSFLVKHLRIHWLEGAEWFWDTLVDADLANNSMGWQWVAGSGADASPYFRIFNPMTQGEKFGAHDYVRKWVPEVAGLPDKYLFAPFEAAPEILTQAGIELGKTYPEPLVDHKAAREAALEAYAEIKG